MSAYHAAADNADPDQCDDRYPEDFIERYNGPFTVTFGCDLLAHLLPMSWGYVPDTVDEELLSAGDVWWSLGVKDDLGREIILVMEHKPDVDYESNDEHFTIRTTKQPRTMTDIQKLVEQYEPQIDHWWCHRNTSANPSEKGEKTDDQKQSWEIVVSDPVNFISELNSLLKIDGSEKVEDYIKLHFVMKEDVLYARLITDVYGNGDFPAVSFGIGDSIEAVYTNANGTDAIDVFVFYNAFMKVIACDTRKVDSILICYDDDESKDITIKFQESVTFAEEHCPTTVL